MAPFVSPSVGMVYRVSHISLQISGEKANKEKKTDATGNVNEKAGGIKRGFPLCVPLDLTLGAYLLCSVADLLMSGIITLSAEAVCFGFCHRFIITLIAKHSARKQSSLPLV